MWKAARQQVDSVVSMRSLMYKKGQLFHGGYTLLGAFANPVFLSKLIRKVAARREKFSGMETSALGEFVSWTVPVEMALKEEAI